MSENNFDNKLFGKTSKFSSTVPVGETWYKRINLTEPGADYIYLIKEDQNYNRVIKLTRGEAGNGTCYKQAPGCKKYFSLRHIRENVVEISVKLLSKSVQGVYALYYYCKWTAHNCNRDGPIMKFLLISEGKVRWFTSFEIVHLLSEYPGGHLTLKIPRSDC